MVQTNNVQQLVDKTNEHSFWQVNILKMFEAGKLSIDEIQYFFSQHISYSKNFTKLLSLVTSRLDNPEHRAQIVENLWEEAGEGDIKNNHARMYNDFLKDIAIDVSLGQKDSRSYAKYYADSCLKYLSNCSPAQACAFIGFGTEMIVPKLYSTYIKNFKAVEMPEDIYKFFSLHVECDDGHADTLIDIAVDYLDQYDSVERWQADCWAAVDYALTLRSEFYDNIYEDIISNKVKSLNSEVLSIDGFKSRNHRCLDDVNEAQILYKNSEGDKNFQVQRFNVSASVLDPRYIRIPQGGRNEHHLHAHESVFYVERGEGKVIVGDKEIPVSAGSVAYVPRWVAHHTENTGSEDLCIFAITDYGYTKRFSGNTEESYREQPKNLGVAATLSE